MPKEHERNRTPRQRRRYRARSAVWLSRNSTLNQPGKAEAFDGSYQCHYCERNFTRKRITVDHIVPRARWKGATECESDANKIHACKPCNQEKLDRFPDCPCASCQHAIDLYRKWVAGVWVEQVDLDGVA